ncbi:MAG: YcjF family protein, partial [Desulfamplus sp.]
APMTSKERISEANHIVKNRMIASVGAGLIPFPVVDIVALTGIQLDTVRALCKLYNIQFSKDIGKTAVTTLTGGVVPVVSAPWVSSLAKTIPFVGQIVGAASMPIIAGASTYAVGKVFIQHFESGGTFLTFDPEKVKGYFKEEFEKGKEFAKNEAKVS